MEADLPSVCRSWTRLVLVVGIYLAAGAPATWGATLLVETNPFGASLTIEEPALEERGSVTTPAVLRGLPQGPVTVRIAKEGYEVERRTVSLDGPSTTVLSVRLQPTRYTTSFPEAANVTIDGAATQEPYLHLPEGPISVESDVDGISLEPGYPRQHIIDGLSLALPMAAILTATIAAVEWASPREPVPRLSPGVAAGFATTLGLLGATTAVHIQRVRYLSAYRYEESLHTVVDADALMEEIDAAVARGELETAEELLERFHIQFPEDPRADDALYLRGQLFLVVGNSAGAYEALSRLVEEYPTREYHDRSLGLLAGIEEEWGNSEAAAAIRSRRLFSDDS